MYVFRWAALGWMGGVMLVGAAERPVRVYPTPQTMQLSGVTVAVHSGVRVEGADTADADAVNVLRGLLSANGAPGAGGIPVLRIGERDDPAVRADAGGLPEQSGAYRIIIAPDRIALVGHDARGTFYAAQTFRQLLGFNGTPGALPAGIITDAPAIEFRGTVEGFYGTPWTHENRKAQLEFYGRHKMNTYIYGPKDDPYHRAPHWRKPYPAKDAERIRELVQVAQANKVDFVWAIHPGGDIKWTEEDAKAVLAKFEAMYELGVRSFSVFFDDIGGEGTNPTRQAELLNRLHREFVQAKGDVTPLVLCPTQYNKGWSKGEYLDILGTQLDPSIHVMWTGNTVVADIDRATMEWINRRLRRKAYIWWNFPVSDYARNHLLMGPAYGNGPDIGPMVAGFVSNPMERAEASKVAIYGVAGFTWNPPAYDANAAWEAAMHEIMPRAADAFRTFCAHNSDLGPNGHGYRRDESVEIRPFIETLSSVSADPEARKLALQRVREEFDRIAAAPAAIRAGADHPRLIEEIGPWLDAFEQLGIAGQGAMAYLTARTKAEAWAALSRAYAARARASEIDRTQNRNPHQPGVKTGSKTLVPFVEKTLQFGQARLQTVITGKPSMHPSPIVPYGRQDGADRMIDSDPESYYYCRQDQKVGDVFGLDLGWAAPVRHVRLTMGRKDGDHDIVHQGQLEITMDGKTWQPLGPVTVGERVEWRGAPVSARQVRYRVLHAGKLDGSKNHIWTAIRDFQVNPVNTMPRVHTPVAMWEKAPLRLEGEAITLAPQFEVVALRPGQFLGLAFPDPVVLGRIEADLASDPAGWLQWEVVRAGSGWTPLHSTVEGTKIIATVGNEAVRAIRLRQVGQAPRDVKLSAFRVECPSAKDQAPAWADGVGETSAPIGPRLEIPVPASARGVALLWAPGAGALVKVGLLTPGATAPQRASATGDLMELELPASGGRLVLESASPDARLHELLWLDRPPKS